MKRRMMDEGCATPTCSLEFTCCSMLHTKTSPEPLHSRPYLVGTCLGRSFGRHYLGFLPGERWALILHRFRDCSNDCRATTGRSRVNTLC